MHGAVCSRAVKKFTVVSPLVCSVALSHPITSRRDLTTSSQLTSPPLPTPQLPTNMASTTLFKVTSFGSPSEGRSDPRPTPATDAFDSDVGVAPPPMDFAAVTKILGPISDTLNELAEEAMYPSPPINTPVVSSPTPSIQARFTGRHRGFSGIGDRLAQLKIDHHHHRGTDMASSSRSMEPSVAEECNESEVASVSEVMSDGCKDKDCPGHGGMSMSYPLPSSLSTGSVPIALGSPTVNPRIEEYLSFTSNDLPTQAPAPATGITLAEHALSTSTAGAASLHSRVSDGVTENSNWAQELEESLERTCLSLEQLAKDEHTADPSKTQNEYYIARMKRLLGSNKRKIPVDIADTSSNPD
jgi:hypothetical protein